ncbi:MAG: molybdenum cofactor synthesis domain protein [Acidimicrobiaceae bacterium]|nr:molybdenum cofactor synthesis domain protein [Acidimicrobiaceae bacterium]
MTISESVADGTRDDGSGDVLVARLVQSGFTVVDRVVTRDGADNVARTLRHLCEGFSGLVVTTGGTGFAVNDQTPEGTLRVLERQAPGLSEAMRAINPLGRLSRGVAGTVGQALVLNLPGSPKGVAECFDAVSDVLEHALDLMGGGHPH